MELTDKQRLVYNRALELFRVPPAKVEAILNKLKSTLDIDLQEYSDQMILDLLNDTVYDPAENNLAAKFIMPPFSVLDSRGGEWQKRRQLLNDYLGSSLVGRKEGLAYGDLQVRQNDNGTSQFDSVLCELLLKWFGFPNCNVLDPFCGGLVRGAMAALLGYEYVGIDLSTSQIEANQKRGGELNLTNVTWICDDALNLDKYVKDNSQDLVFTCPPYGDLEQYTDDPRDLSNMAYDDFKSAYGKVLGLSMGKLKDNRFAVVVVGDFRDKQGYYRGFVADTIKIMADLGVGLYNEAILLNSVGTASMRASSSFGNRKLVKVHQNVLVFYKGDPGQIKNLYKTVDNNLPVPTPKQNALF